MRKMRKNEKREKNYDGNNRKLLASLLLDCSNGRDSIKLGDCSHRRPNTRLYFATS